MKYFIISDKNNRDNRRKLADHISKRYDLDLAEHFSNDENYGTIIYSMNDINIAYKNNAILSCIANENIIYGISNDEFYNSNIFEMDIDEFNSISEAKFTNVIVVWLDSTYHNDVNFTDIKILEETLSNIQYMYFINIEDAISTLEQFIIGNDDIRLKLIENNQ